LLLVLNRTNETLGSPVEGGRDVSLFEEAGRRRAVVGSLNSLGTGVEGGEFLVGEISELVHSELVAGLFHVVVVNFVEVGLENVVSNSVFRSSVGSVVFSLP
jgi:hypothetical protein